MSDRQILECTAQMAGDERRVTADLLALLGEVDARRLYLGEGCASLFTYCIQVLHLSEHAAYHRIEAARAARRYPMILKLVAEGSVTLTTIALLRPHLTAENHEALFAEARHKSKRDVEYQIACLAPKPAAPALLRRLPNHPAQGPTAIRAVEPRGSIARAEIEHLETLAGTDLVPAVAADLLISPSQPAEASSAPEPQSRVSVLAKDRYLLRVTLNSETYAKLKRAQQLMSHSVRDGNPAVILDKALDLLVAGLERAKIANVRRPRAQRMVRPSPSSSGSRHIPAALRREVWARDGGRCAFVGTRGRCTETARLELHHVTPFARGGPTGVDNLALRCRAHNVYESEQIFGPRPRRPRKAPRQSASP